MPARPLRHAIAGLMVTALELQLVFSPNSNSLRRFAPAQFAPMRIVWGYDHRNAAVRVPSASGPDARLEHRIAGADAQPYLALAAILGGVLLGLERKAEPPPPIRPEEPAGAGAQLARSWADVIERFARSDLAAGMLGANFRNLYANMKRLERNELEHSVPDTELAAYFHRA